MLSSVYPELAEGSKHGLSSFDRLRMTGWGSGMKGEISLTCSSVLLYLTYPEKEILLKEEEVCVY
jgi:hypothetical protein